MKKEELFWEADREKYTGILIIYFFSQSLENVVTFYGESLVDLVHL